MAVERLAPDAILAQTNLTGGVAAIQDDPDAPDGAWLTSSGTNIATAVRVSFPMPLGPLTPGAGLQNFRVRWRKTNQASNPLGTIELFENGVLVSTLVSGVAVSSTTGVVQAATWDGAGRNPGLIECRVSGAPGGGQPATRAALQVGGIEWNVDYQEEVVDVATYIELRNLANDSTLRNRSEVAIVVSANAILRTTPAPLDEQIGWAQDVLENPSRWAQQALFASLAQNRTLSVAEIQGATDDALQTVIDQIVPLLAKGFTPGG